MTGNAADDEISPALDVALSSITSDDADEVDPEFERFMQWVETSPRARRRRARRTYFLTTSHRWTIGVFGVGRIVDEIHANLAARFKQHNEQPGSALVYATREFEMHRYQGHADEISPLVLAARGFRPNFFVIVQNSRKLENLTAAGIEELAMLCCQAVNPKEDIDPFVAAFLVRASFKHFEEYQRRAAGKPWCAVGQYSMDPRGLDHLEDTIVRAAAALTPGE
jgi:hypothetical protein